MVMTSVRNGLNKMTLAGAAALVVLLSSFAPADQHAVTDGKVVAAIQVKYLGGDNDALFFKVKYENKAGSKFKLLALDETGEALFQDNYSVKDFDKKLKIPRLKETDYVIFLVKSPKDNVEISYKVRVTTKVVDDGLVTKN